MTKLRMVWVRDNGQAELRDNIDTVLRDRGSNRSRLARETGLKYSQIAAAFAGSWMSRELVETIADHLELDVDELVGASIFKDDRERYIDFDYRPGTRPPSALDDEKTLAEQGHARAICCTCGSLRLTSKLTYTGGGFDHQTEAGRMLADLHCRTCDEVTRHAELRVDDNRNVAEQVDQAPTRDALARQELDALVKRLARFNVRVKFERSWCEDLIDEGYVHVYWWDPPKKRWYIQLDPAAPVRLQIKAAEDMWSYLSTGKHVPSDGSYLGYRSGTSHWDAAVEDLVADLDRFIDVERRRMVADLNDQIAQQGATENDRDHDEESWA